MLKENGLTKKEAEERLAKYGLNEIKDVSKSTPLKILLRQIKNNFIIYLLFIATLISFFVGKQVTGYAILVVILMVILAGFIQEFRAEKAVNSLKNMLVPVSIVIRDGKEQEIESKNLVPGDILILRNGEKIPADCVILESTGLALNESILTGESGEVEKKSTNSQNYSDENLVFMGTYIVNGKCFAKVLKTGEDTKFGKIAKLISSTEKELPLQKKVNKVAKYMAILSIIVSISTGAIMFFQSEVINTSVIINVLIIVIALSVSAFPEGLPVVLITTLASGAHLMAKKNAIVNRMSIIETLGETTVICSDKTGTITKGEMTVKKIFAGNSFFEVTGTGFDSRGDFLRDGKKIDFSKEEALSILFRNSALCNDSILEKNGSSSEFKIIGSPTEAALSILAAKAGIFKENIKCSLIEEIPFNSERKMMSVLYELNKEKIVYSKGALEYLLKHCNFIQKNGLIVKLTEKERANILQANSLMASSSLRTIAFAYKKLKGISKNNIEEDLIFIGLAGMEDPPRAEVKEAISLCLNAGISVKMITGDNKETALAVAKEIGLIGKLMEGYELDKLSDTQLAKAISSISIFARVKPEDKLRIVKALKSNGEIVTMTGDGVNDAPALKEAHIGVAMGKNGTDVSRSVADLTIKDDNFTTIVSAISEGRTIFKNIRKFVTYQLSCNLAELAILFFGVLFAPLLGWQVPVLLALQILFMNLVTDNLPAITLGFNPPSKDIMVGKPLKNSGILNKRLFGLLFFTSALLMFFVLSAHFISFNILGKSINYSRTVALFSLICLEIVSAFNFRSFRKRVLNRGLLVNPYLFYASLISLIATFIIIYTPLNKVFETVPLGIEGVVISLSLSLLFIVIFDFLKYLNSKKNFFDSR